MLEPPDLRQAAIIDGVRDGYGIPVTAVEFLPLGNDSSSWVYRLDVDDGGSLFLKLRKGPVYPPSLTVPSYLYNQGIHQVVAPRATRTGDLWMMVEDFALALYPYIGGGTGMELGMSAAQWSEFGDVLARIHSQRPPPKLATTLRRETFVPAWSGVVERLQRRVAAGGQLGVCERDLASLWRDRRDQIIRIVARAHQLGVLLRRRPTELVLCHCDIHTANILADGDRGIHIVDWDAPMLAPRERDLMFVVHSAEDGSVAAGQEALFFAGYGATEIDALGLAYYRYEWVVQEIADYGERVLLRPEVGAETKRAAVESFLELFQPGDVVEAAYESDRHDFAG